MEGKGLKYGASLSGGALHIWGCWVGVGVRLEWVEGGGKGLEGVHRLVIYYRILENRPRESLILLAGGGGGGEEEKEEEEDQEEKEEEEEEPPFFF